MINLEAHGLEIIRNILSKLYLEDGFTEEVILLGGIVDKVILDSYVES